MQRNWLGTQFFHPGSGMVFQTFHLPCRSCYDVVGHERYLKKLKNTARRDGVAGVRWGKERLAMRAERIRGVRF
ncbi:hypothetical protein PGTUg99_008304 [Puccinia graminis f. sp. tritici]|uniref:Uncharacterized protein n=1 Tax=Puccinia graminis f. sp. tritici TaxID=56615 RepID=A0A5B0S336_PUCGR|nr:hypothetical protein PGTUg99_008304 [Puccinia graminis f. sp. tritici]